MWLCDVVVWLCGMVWCVNVVSGNACWWHDGGQCRM